MKSNIIKAKPTAAQQAFGAKFGNEEIITARPSGMSYKTYRRARSEQQKRIKRMLR